MADDEMPVAPAITRASRGPPAEGEPEREPDHRG